MGLDPPHHIGNNNTQLTRRIDEQTQQITLLTNSNLSLIHKLDDILKATVNVENMFIEFIKKYESNIEDSPKKEDIEKIFVELKKLTK
jgi:hypothetical protein